MLQRLQKFRWFFCVVTLGTLILALSTLRLPRLMASEMATRIGHTYSPEEWRGEVSFTRWMSPATPRGYSELMGQFGRGNVDGAFAVPLVFSSIPSLSTVSSAGSRWVTYRFYVSKDPTTPEQARYDSGVKHARPAFSDELLALSRVYSLGNSTADLGQEIVAAGSEAQRCLVVSGLTRRVCEPVIAQLRYNGDYGVSFEVASPRTLKPSGTHFLMVVEE